MAVTHSHPCHLTPPAFYLLDRVAGTSAGFFQGVPEIEEVRLQFLLSGPESSHITAQFQHKIVSVEKLRECDRFSCQVALRRTSLAPHFLKEV